MLLSEKFHFPITRNQEKARVPIIHHFPTVNRHVYVDDVHVCIKIFENIDVVCILKKCYLFY